MKIRKNFAWQIFLALSLVLALIAPTTQVQTAQAGGTCWRAADNLHIARMLHTATLLADGRILVAGGRNSVGTALTSVEIYNPITNTWVVAQSMQHARLDHTAVVLQDGRLLVAGGDATGDSVEIYDPTDNSWFQADSLTYARSEHTATLLPDGRVLVAGGYGTSDYLNRAEIYDPGRNRWTDTPIMRAARESHTAVLMVDGRVLVAGGAGAGGVLASSEIYDPEANTWVYTAGPMHYARSEHTATLLTANRRVLVAGGGSHADTTEVYDPTADAWTVKQPLNTARTGHHAVRLTNGQVMVLGGFGTPSREIYDPGTNTWLESDPMPVDRFRHTATLLPDGRVLVTGGDGDGPPSVALDRTDICRPLGPSWQAADNLNTARTRHTATLLKNDKVLVTGGQDYAAVDEYLNSAELYEPGTNTWTATPSMSVDRNLHTATLLMDGRVLIVGGYDILIQGGMSSAEIYNPETNSFSGAADMAWARYSHQATLLVDGKVLVTGGRLEYWNGKAESYDPALNTWTEVASLNYSRQNHTATLLPDGTVLVAGGIYWNGSTTIRTNSVELYDPGADTWTIVASMNITRTAHTDDGRQYERQPSNPHSYPVAIRAGTGSGGVERRSRQRRDLLSRPEFLAGDGQLG